MNARLEVAIKKALLKLMTAFPNRDIANIDETVLVYYEACTDLDPLDIEGGVVRAIRSEGRYFPSPAVLRAYALEERTARSVHIRPVQQNEETKCPLCGATRLWLRKVTTPAPDPKYFTQRAINSGAFVSRELERAEIEHRLECPIRRPDQPALILTKGAA